MKFQTGDRVVRTGRVDFERSGFVRVNWDDGGSSEVWAPGLTLVVEQVTEDGGRWERLVSVWKKRRRS